MPLKVGESWVYMARTGLQSLPDNVRVTRSVSVGDTEGVELSGDLGTAHLAWDGNRLVTDQMAQCRFVHPLPLLEAAQSKPWQGWMLRGDKRYAFKAFTSQAPAKLDVMGMQANTICSSVELWSDKQHVEIKTWFESGVGIVRQEQRTNDRLDLTLELLAR
jgi:hypothetical protein